MIPAADDFASHESLKMAAHHDPEGLRTLGVVTKTDRIEEGRGFQAKMRAEGKGHIKLRLGFVAVKNRTQREVEDNLSFEDARRAEAAFFENDPRVAGLTSDLWGMETVIDKIVGIQSERVQEFIPKALNLVMEKIKVKQYFGVPID